MKILIANDGPTAFYYIRTGLARAFHASGHEVLLWDIHKKPAFDMFDEFEPDIFLGQTYNTLSPLVKVIKERPHMKVIMKGCDWGPKIDKIPLDDFGILTSSKTTQHTILDLYEETGKPDYLHIYYHPDYIGETHGHWINKGIPVHSHMLGADVFDYTNGKRMERFVSDMTFIGGYWPYKAQNIDSFLLPLCHSNKYNIKIFGNAHWPVVQYCGHIPTEMAKHALASATICPQLHEPHSTYYGFDMSERTFKLLSNKCFVVSDYVEGLHKLFGDDLVMAKTADEFKKLIDHYLANPEERNGYILKGYQKVMSEHTYFHRVRDIFNNLNLPQYAKKTMETYDNIRKQIENEL